MPRSQTFVLPEKCILTYADALYRRSRCYRYAIAEMRRLLGRIGVAVKARAQRDRGKTPRFSLHGDLVTEHRVPALSRGLRPDGYGIRISRTALTAVAPTPKGVLNAVYDVAERLGYLFLLPGEAGEWPPADRPWPLPCGSHRAQPRFPHRGVELGGAPKDYSTAEWMRFYAKLRFNAMVAHYSPDMKEAIALAEELGIRLEAGGHGLPQLRARKRFAREPGLFRMVQPEDFHGQRQGDYNLCASHPRGQRAVRDAYRRELRKHPQLYALHAWADDLPGGGWCLCPSCRSFTNADQAMMAMHALGEAAAAEGKRVPLLAYHDTLVPGLQVKPPRSGFLLFAPRERCYGHALDDPSCARNRVYCDALAAWMRTSADLDDAHTFEYYVDQGRFRGLYPFLPDAIRADMRAYRAAGIESHMALQVAGPAVAPEHNMLFFAKALWDERWTPLAHARWLAHRICPSDPAAWAAFLRGRARIFQDAMRFCGHDPSVYMDYRWLPETTSPFGETMRVAYVRATAELDDLARRLQRRMRKSWPARATALALREIRRARFEAAEFRVMAEQQTAVNRLGQHLATGDCRCLRPALEALTRARTALRAARGRARDTGLETDAYYFGLNAWLDREFAAKIRRTREALRAAPRPRRGMARTSVNAE